MKKYILLGVLAIAACTTIRAQINVRNTQSASHPDYARHPVWIGMMQDTLANFYEVEKAFNTYFAHHEKPEGEEAEINEHRERLKNVSKRRMRRIEAENALRMDVKRYEVWRERTLPYVQDDGRILTPSERLTIWKTQSGSRR